MPFLRPPKVFESCMGNKKCMRSPNSDRIDGNLCCKKRDAYADDECVRKVITVSVKGRYIRAQISLIPSHEHLHQFHFVGSGIPKGKSDFLLHLFCWVIVTRQILSAISWAKGWPCTNAGFVAITAIGQLIPLPVSSKHWVRGGFPQQTNSRIPIGSNGNFHRFVVSALVSFLTESYPSKTGWFPSLLHFCWRKCSARQNVRTSFIDKVLAPPFAWAESIRRAHPILSKVGSIPFWSSQNCFAVVHIVEEKMKKRTITLLLIGNRLENSDKWTLGRFTNGAISWASIGFWVWHREQKGVWRPNVNLVYCNFC